MKFISLGGICIAVAAIAMPAVAHHSHAMFDQDVSVEIEGTVVAFNWTNPHSWLHIIVQDENGEAKRWSLEMGVPGALARRGMRPNTFMPGDKLSVVIHPLKDGAPGGELLAVTLPNGVTIDEL